MRGSSDRGGERGCGPSVWPPGPWSPGSLRADRTGLVVPATGVGVNPDPRRGAARGPGCGPAVERARGSFRSTGARGSRSCADKWTRAGALGPASCPEGTESLTNFGLVQTPGRFLRTLTRRASGTTPTAGDTSLEPCDSPGSRGQLDRWACPLCGDFRDRARGTHLTLGLPNESPSLASCLGSVLQAPGIRCQAPESAPETMPGPFWAGIGPQGGSASGDGR